MTAVTAKYDHYGGTTASAIHGARCAKMDQAKKKKALHKDEIIVARGTG